MTGFVHLRVHTEYSLVDSVVRVDPLVDTLDKLGMPACAITDQGNVSALVKFYPHLEQVRLTDYKVRIVNSLVGTAARTRVLIESSDGLSSWTTIGVHENIIEASLQALVDSLEYGLLKKEFAAGVM